MVDKGTVQRKFLLRSTYALRCIRQQHYRIIAFGRRLIIKSRMAMFKVIAVDITSNCSSGFFDIIGLCQIGFLIFETAEPAFTPHIIRPTAFSIHALTDSILFGKINIPLAGKLTSLVKTQNPGFCNLKCFFQSCNHHSGIQGIIHFPACNTTAVPISDSCQVQISSTDWNLTNINRPGLIWFIYKRITEQIWLNIVFCSNGIEIFFSF